MKTNSRSASRDSVLAHLMEDYLASCEMGSPLTGDELAARFPELAEEVGDCLASLEFIRRAAANRGSSAVGSILGLTADTDAVTSALGDFRIVREIGRGGMGVVYEAEQISLARRVALKVLPFTCVLDARQLARFKNEALAAASLDHPHIVNVLGVGCDRGTHYYAMRLIDGCNLADVIAELRDFRSGQAAAPYHSDEETDRNAVSSPLCESSVETRTRAILSTLGLAEQEGRSPELYRQIAGLAADAADALHHAHEQGVIHRDIKPSNLMLDERGKIWITDFGLAHIESNATLTISGDLVGTLRYMSPEQASGSLLGVDHRADVYSFGATLYELLTLRPVFESEHRGELLRQISHDEPVTPRRHDDSIPGDLETVVLKALAKDPADRYASAAELGADLRRFLSHEPIRAKRPSLRARVRSWGRRNRRVVIAAALGGLAALLLSGIFVWRSWSDALAQRRIAELRRQQADANFTKGFGGHLGMLYRLGSADRERTPEMEALREEFLQDGLDYYDQFCMPDDPSPWVRRQAADAHTHKGYVWQLKGDESRAIGEFRKSRDILAELTRQFPEDVSYWRALGAAEDVLAITYWENGDVAAAVEQFDRSIRAYERGLALDPRNVSCANTLAWALVMKHDPALQHPARALALTEQSLRQVPDRPSTLFILGVAQLRAERFEEASRTLEKAQRASVNLDLSHRLPAPYYSLPRVIALARTGKIDAAQAELAQSERWLERNFLDHRELNRWLAEAREAVRDALASGGVEAVERAAGEGARKLIGFESGRRGSAVRQKPRAGLG